MLTICEYLLDAMPNCTILLVSGSSMLHSFRLPRRLDYIKLPCLAYAAGDGYTGTSIGVSLRETVRLRAALMRNAVAYFQPEVFLVDTQPYGVKHELRPALTHQQQVHPTSKRVLVLGDILDSPETTRAVWRERRYHDAIETLYDQVWVLGSAAIFDVAKEYRFPAVVADKLRYCGYIRPIRPAHQHAASPREAKHILVSAGGDADGYRLLEAYLTGLHGFPLCAQARSLVVCDAEMPPSQRKHLSMLVTRYPHVQLHTFTDDMLAPMSQADVVVSTADYNTICELLSLHKQAVVVPRTQPLAEQWIRASRMAHLGLFHVLHPDHLTPSRLLAMVHNALLLPPAPVASWYPVDLGALPRIARALEFLLAPQSNRTFHFAPQSQGAPIATMC
jgi:predicted glycosyltransferase